MNAGVQVVRSLRYVVVIALLAASGLAGGCGQRAAGNDPAALEGVEWTLTSASVSSQNLSEFGITATFDGARMAGFSGVNSYTGEYEASEDGSFKAGPLASTMMAGPEKNMAAEKVYLTLVEAATSYEVAGGKLTLKEGEGTTLIFEAAKPFSFPGTSWSVTGYNNGKQAVVGPIVDSELTLDFADDKTVSGSAGVNNFNGEYTSGEDAISIGPLASTKKMGDPELMTQEQAYLAALGAASTWEVSNGVLTMRDGKGAIQIIAAKK